MKNIVLIIVLVAALLVLVFIGTRTEPVNEPAPEPEEVSTEQTYAAPEYGLSFTYPLNYYLSEREVGTGEQQQRSIVIIEDSEQNRALLSGDSGLATEIPVHIVVDVFENPNALTAEQWVEQSTNWTIRTSPSEPIGVGGYDGVAYTWSGLYEGRSVIVTNDRYAFMFSVTWISPEDETLRVFETLLESVKVDTL